MSALIIIPARMASTRLPGKPLADIAGSPMIVHVMRAAMAANAGPVWVACAEAEIKSAVEAAGGRAVLTDPDLPSGSDRVRQAAERIDPDHAHDIIVNVQGDMPSIDPVLIAEVVKPLLGNPDIDIATAAVRTEIAAEINDPNVVKAVAAASGRALYFTRAAAPSGEGGVDHHIGIYAYRRRALEAFCALPPSPLEQRERLEQLRALEAGMYIHIQKVPVSPHGVDTPEDLARARVVLAGAKLAEQ